MSNLIPASTLPYLAGTAAVIGCVPTAIGLSTLARPQTLLDLADFPSPSAQATPQDRRLVDGLLTYLGGRDLALGLMTLSAWYLLCRGGNTTGHTTLGAMSLIGAGLDAEEGYIAGKVAGGGQWKRWCFVPVQVGIGFALLGWI